ncbi:thiolase family protein [Paenalcaligenes hominis]|uniref:thiolase family protein n=1 Tax=Paenalcaligenes hominis TaxID=643674 RepID=UPI00352463C7
MKRSPYTDVVLVCPVTVAYERFSEKSAHQWLGTALKNLLQQSGLQKQDIDGVCVSSFTLGSDTAVGLMQHFQMSPRFLEHIPMGGASGIIALRRAARAVQCGDANVVACLAGDTNHRDSFKNTVSGFSRFSQDAVYPYGAAGPNGSFALLTDYYMQHYGATRADFGKLCVAQRDNALRNPHALMKKPLTLEQYLEARPIAEPIHLFDCVMPCAGAEGYLVMRREQAQALHLPYVEVLSTIERHNAFTEDPVQYRGGWALDVDELYEMAHVQPEHIDFLETYDDYPVINVLQFEDLGFCKKGEGPQFIRNHSFTIDGSFPFNTSGGQLSVGQAGAAGGYLGLVQALRQLTLSAAATQIPNATVGMVSGFGMINYDRGICTAATILKRGQA